MGSPTIRLARELALPIETVTQAIAILAKRRAGKSYTARRLAEQLHHAGQQLVIVDPKGDWWGIRSAADGKSPGLPIIILGGERGDVPLEVGAGDVVARLVAEERASVLLDLSLFRKHEVATFMAAFLEGLYRLKAREAYRTPLMLLIDEADAVAPQKPQENEARMLGAAEDIVRRGGQRGIGCTMITQRSAVLNKNVLTQCEVIIALRTIAPQDLKALDAWVEVHGEREQRDTLMASLPSLPVGDAWFWSPGWPTAAGIFQRVHVLPIETFDSGASPKPGEKRVEPKNLADVDLGALTRQMAETIEKAKANDPKALRAEIAQLRKELSGAKLASVQLQPSVVAQLERRGYELAKRELRNILGRDLDRVAKSVDRLRQIASSLENAGTDAAAAVLALEGTLDATAAPTASAPARETPRQVAQRAAAAGTNYIPTKREAATEGLTPSDQKILDALALLETLGVPGDRTSLAFFAGYTVGGRFNNLVGSLRSRGLVDYPTPSLVALTDAGRAVADGARHSVQSLDDLHRIWSAKLPPSEWSVLNELLARYPDSLTREELAEVTGYTIGGRFNNIVGRLSGLGAVEYPAKGSVRAAAVLFPEGL